MTGEVSAEREAVLRITVRGPGEASANVAAVIDTGFTDFLVLPLETIAHLGLPRITQMEALLGDGSHVFLPVFRATVEWNNQERVIYVHGSDSGPLLGMGLLYDFHLEMDVVDGGRVTVGQMAQR